MSFTHELYATDDSHEMGRLIMWLAAAQIKAIVDVRRSISSPFYVALVDPSYAISATRLRDQYFALTNAQSKQGRAFSPVCPDWSPDTDD